MGVGAEDAAARRLLVNLLEDLCNEEVCFMCMFMINQVYKMMCMIYDVYKMSCVLYLLGDLCNEEVCLMYMCKTNQECSIR